MFSRAPWKIQEAGSLKRSALDRLHVPQESPKITSHTTFAIHKLHTYHYLNLPKSGLSIHGYLLYWDTTNKAGNGSLGYACILRNSSLKTSWPGLRPDPKRCVQATLWVYGLWSLGSYV